MKLAALIGFGVLAFASGAFPQQGEPVYQSDVGRLQPSSEPSSTPENTKSPEEKKPMFHRSDKRERVVKAPDKPVQIKKLKFGGDQTEGGGRFKGSIIEEEGDLAGYKKAVTAAKAASPVPQATQAPSPAAAGKSTPTPTPTPKPTPASRPAPSP